MPTETTDRLLKMFDLAYLENSQKQSYKKQLQDSSKNNQNLMNLNSLLGFVDDNISETASEKQKLYNLFKKQPSFTLSSNSANTSSTLLSKQISLNQIHISDLELQVALITNKYENLKQQQQLMIKIFSFFLVLVLILIFV